MFTIDVAAGQLRVGVQDLTLWTLDAPALQSEDGQHHPGSPWTEREAGFESANAVFSCRCLPRRHTHYWSFAFDITFHQAAAVHHLGITQQFHAQHMHHLDRGYQWQASGSTAATIDSLTPVCLTGQHGDQSITLQYRRHALVQFADAPGTFVTFFDHKATHPRVSHHAGAPPRRDAFQSQPDQRLSIEALLFIRSAAPGQPVIPLPWRFPDGHLACVVITDHADWDNTEKLAALYTAGEGFNATRVKTTKSVFWGTVGYETPDKTFQPHGLDVPEFAALMEDLHAAGHEICPHAIVVRPKAPGWQTPHTMIAQALDTFAARYGCGTWIDHGLNAQLNYTQQGWNPASTWYLLDMLKQRGFNNVWAYVDTRRYPVKHINQLAPPDTSADYLRAAAQKARRMDSWNSANYAKFALEQRLGARGKTHIDTIAHFMKLVTSRNYTPKAKVKRMLHSALRIPPALLKLLYLLAVGDARDDGDSGCPVLYSEAGLPLGQANPDDLLLFTSSLTNNLYDAWSQLPALIAQRGIHIAHTYLCNTFLRYGTPTLVQRSGTWAVSPQFSDVLSALDTAVARKDIWNPTMQRFAAWFRSWMQVQVDPIGPTSIRLTNPTGTAIHEYTLLFPPHTQQVRHGDRPLTPVSTSPLLFSVTLEPHASLDLHWH